MLVAGGTRVRSLTWAEKFFATINGVKFSAAEFTGAIRTIESLGQNAHNPKSREIALLKFFSEKRYSILESCRRTDAVEYRMDALLRLKDKHGLLSWDIPGKKVLNSTRDPYLAAAATEPLIKHGRNDVAFDPESFRARLIGARANRRDSTMGFEADPHG